MYDASCLALETALDDAHEKIPTDQAVLLSWASDPESLILIELTLAAYGLPEPELDERGDAIPGSIMAKLARQAWIDQLVHERFAHPSPK